MTNKPHSTNRHAKQGGPSTERDGELALFLERVRGLMSGPAKTFTARAVPRRLDVPCRFQNGECTAVTLLETLEDNQDGIVVFEDINGFFRRPSNDALDETTNSRNKETQHGESI